MTGTTEVLKCVSNQKIDPICINPENKFLVLLREQSVYGVNDLDSFIFAGSD